MWRGLPYTILWRWLAGRSGRSHDRASQSGRPVGFEDRQLLVLGGDNRWWTNVAADLVVAVGVGS